MLTIALVSLLPITFLFSIIWWYVIYFKYEPYFQRFSGPSHIPIFGGIHHFGIKGSVLSTFSKHLKKYKSPMKFFLGYNPVLVLADPKSIEFVLGSNKILSKSFQYRFLHAWLGQGLLTSDGTRWKTHRKMLTPAFHFQILEKFIDVFDTQSNILIRKLEKVKNKEVDIFPYITLCALDVICEATMNTSIKAQINPTSNYVQSVKDMCRILTYRSTTLKMFDAFYVFTKDYQKEKQALSFLHELSNSVITKRREKLLSQQVCNLTDLEGSKNRVAFLDLLLTSTVDGKCLTNKAVREEVDTFMFEGHDTTTSGISFTLYLLSKHPEIQEKVLDEIITTFGNEKNLQLTYEGLQNLKYLEQVIKEALRMYPPVPIISRLITEDALYDGQILPKGTVMKIFAYDLHNNPSLFPNPDVFDPERFNATNSKKISLYSYIPFSAGPRNCIGILSTLSENIKKYKSPMTFFLGYNPVLILADPKSIEFVTGSNKIISKSFQYKFLHAWLGQGLLTSDGTRWKAHRRLLTPAFHFQILEKFIEVFDTQSNILIQKLDKVKNEEIDIFPYITLCALDVICEATMNTSIKAQLNPTSSYVESVKDMCRIIVYRATTLKMFDIFYVFSKDYQKEKRALRFLHELSNSVIANRRDELLTQQVYNLTDLEGSRKRIAFLDLLLTSTVDGKPLTKEAIREEVDTFMFEGHDTTTSGISFTLYLLSKHQEVQKKVLDEIITTFGDETILQLSYEGLQNLKYLEQVIKESLRMYPPVPIISRLVTEDVLYDGQIIPKGTVTVIFAYELHNNPSIFPNPDVFDPERFNVTNSKNISLYSYIPFSAGPRNCIGQKFAMLELKASVCKVLHKFKLLPVRGHTPKLKADAILISENGLPIRLEERHRY
ncbi:hypothetical protein FQR65_LT03770 [Abscondita terminalis]|nr:hypothetical protein FQR65_LT03770 [Abscondita terminalis]